MALSYTDAWGVVLDTGSNTTITARANTEVEVHTSAEIDTASTISPTVLATKHISHRPSYSVR